MKLDVDFVRHTIIAFFVVIILFFASYALVLAFAEPFIFIDNNRPVGREFTVIVYDKDTSKVRQDNYVLDVEINGNFYHAQSKYNYVALPIKISQHLYDVGIYNGTVTINGQVSYHEFKVRQQSGY